MITVATAVAAVTLGTLCTGCGAKSDSAAKKEIVVTIAPLMDWTRNVLGSHADEFQLTLLQKSGVDLHSFKPSAEDVIRISRCGLFVHIGGESDEWVEDALAEATNKDMLVINLLEALGDAVKEEEIVKRLLERAKVSHRADDNYDTIKHRLQVFHEVTAPVCYYYMQQRNYFIINANYEMKDTFSQIDRILQMVVNCKKD